MLALQCCLQVQLSSLLSIDAQCVYQAKIACCCSTCVCIDQNNCCADFHSSTFLQHGPKLTYSALSNLSTVSKEASQVLICGCPGQILAKDGAAALCS